MAKVSVSAKIPEELKTELEKQAEEKDITLSEHVANLLTQANENTEKRQQEFALLVKEIQEKNKQIQEFQTMQKNEQEIRLYREKTLLIEKEQEQKKISMINESNSPEENGSINPAKKWWKFWGN